jgi:uncharacterized protein
MTTEILSSEECLHLLASQQVGRLAVLAGQYPMVVPVNYAIDGDVIVFRSGPGTKLRAAQHRNVAFEVDEIDLDERHGWSVLATGQAEIVTDDHDPSLVSRTKALPIDPLESDEKETWVRILVASVSGRRISGDSLRTIEVPSEVWLG